MELNHDLVREVLLYIEREFSHNDLRLASSIRIAAYDQSAVLYTVRRLLEARYIVGKPMGYNNVPDSSISALSWAGHEYLDTIRSPEVWRKTKGIASKIGSVSLSAMSQIASEVLSAMIKSATSGV